MTIKRKSSKTPVLVQSDIEDVIGEVINRGGKIASDDAIEKAPLQEQNEKEFRFTLRGPDSLRKKIDEARKTRLGNVSRNQWILEAINNAVK